MIEDRAYLSDPAGVTLIPGCSALIQQAHQLGFAVVVVSNQSGIGRGYFSWHEHDRVERRMIELLALEHAAVDGILANAATPNSGHDWRKPQPGMFFAAAHTLNLDLFRSAIVGDKASDLIAARAAGLPSGGHVLTGHGKQELEVVLTLTEPAFEVSCASTIAHMQATANEAGRCVLKTKTLANQRV